LEVSLSATPDRGVERLLTTLRATVTGSATGTINYSIWWDCDKSSKIVSDLNKPISQGGCGVLPTDCSSNEFGYKCDNVDINPLEVQHWYVGQGRYEAKVIVERGSASPAEERTDIRIDADRAPSARSVKIVPVDYCGLSSPNVGLTWTYDDPDNSPRGADPQKASLVQVATNSSYSSLVYDEVVVSPLESRTIPNLQWNTSYYVRVKVSDSYDKESNWASAQSLPFKTPLHAYPNVDFDSTPETILLNKEATFNDKTIFSGAPKSWAWTWAVCRVGEDKYCSRSTSSVQNPTNTFSKEKTYTATLRAADRDNYACTKVKSFDVGKGSSLPQWREVAP